MYKLNTIGKIMSGEHRGWYVVIKPLDAADDYMIFITEVKPSAETLSPIDLTGKGFDNWCRTAASVEAQIEHNKWIIDWNMDEE